MKKLSLVLSSCVLALSATSAQAEVSANVAMSTDYIWRGMTQTDGEAAVSGGFDYGHESGAYVGVWGSNIDFGSTSSMEFDLYGGYATEISGVGIDVGAIRYMYPSEGSINWTEYYGSVSYMGASVGVAFTDEYGGNDTIDATYYSASYEAELPMQIGLAVSAGYYDIDTPDSDNVDWKIAVSREYQGVGFELSYYDLDSDNDAADDDGVVFTISKSM
ncbi:TorF family putative porin [Motiliproteus sediminis]|uniref:TorF family putative porin n=1 Tax=Motiliproteus sediminis TaxID=1468178 RepID=UPI001AEF7DE0|nr:TorF family putative porin [Motiliproteus sediminis]